MDFITSAKWPQGIHEAPREREDIVPSAQRFERRLMRCANPADRNYAPSNGPDQPEIMGHAHYRPSHAEPPVPQCEQHQDFEHSVGAVIADEQARSRRHLLQPLDPWAKPDPRERPKQRSEAADEFSGVARGWRRHVAGQSPEGQRFQA